MTHVKLPTCYPTTSVLLQLRVNPDREAGRCRPQGCQATVAGFLDRFRRRNARAVRGVRLKPSGPKAGTQEAGSFFLSISKCRQ